MANTIVERWLPVPGADGVYSVSNLGRVRSERRKAEDGRGTRTLKERMLRTQFNHRGYEQVTLLIHGSKRTWSIHRLVLTTFIGPRSQDLQACHNNGAKSDNRLSNLRWGTAEDNTNDKFVHGTVLRGVDSGMAKLTDSQVVHIKSSSQTLRHLASIYQVDHKTIHAIKSGRTWKHVSLRTNHDAASPATVGPAMTPAR